MESTTIPTTTISKRIIYIDLLKGFLITVMVTSHTLYFFPLKSPTFLSGKIAEIHSNLSHITIFSSLFFTFGFVCTKAYIFSQKPNVYSRLGKTVLRMFVAFYISGVLYYVLVKTDQFSIKYLIDLLTLNVVPGYSEFLAAYFLAGLLMLIFLKQLRKILANKYLIILLIFISLLSTFIPNNITNIPQLAYLIGSRQYTTYPVLQYMCLWFAGAALGLNELKVKTRFLLIVGFAGLAFNLIGYYFFGDPNLHRYPPNIFFITSAIFPISMLLIASKYLCSRFCGNMIPRFLIWVGRDTMFFFLFSNVFLFSFYRIGFLYTGSYFLTLGLGLAFIANICLLKFTVVK